MTSQTIFILGAGPRIGNAIAKLFQQKGYSVAVGSRNPASKNWDGANVLQVTVDVTNIKSIEKAFTTVQEKYGAPNVVVYNAAALTFPADVKDPLGIKPEDFERDTAINAVGNYSAMHEALRGFKTIKDDKPKVFISTGNILPWKPSASGITLGPGEAARAHTIDLASRSYGDKGYRFYFASQVVVKDGQRLTTPYDQIVAESHAKVYWELVNESEKRDWNVQFTGNGKFVS